MKMFCRMFVVTLLTVVFLTQSALAIQTETVDYDHFFSHAECGGSYELVAANMQFQSGIEGNFSGNFLYCHGNVNIMTKPIYQFWYKREDGGIVPKTIDLSDTYYKYTQIIVYEDDTVTPKVEYWRYPCCNKGHSELILKGKWQCYNEIRFTVPSGTFVNTYELQDLYEGNS